jgi:nicotinamide riboside kinase
MKPEKVNLPLRPLNQHKITLFNHTGKTIIIDTNSTTDLMYSQIYAPRGEKTLFLEDKRMIKFIYLTLPNNTKFGHWYIMIG